MVRRKVIEAWNWLWIERDYEIKETLEAHKIFNMLKDILYKYKIELYPTFSNDFRIIFGARNIEGKELKGIGARILLTEVSNIQQKYNFIFKGYRGFNNYAHRCKIDVKLKYMEEFCD